MSRAPCSRYPIPQVKHKEADQNTSNNPQGLFYAGSLVGYFLSLPLTSMIAAEGGAFQRNAALLAQSIPGLGDIPSDRIIPAVSALYLFVTFVASGVASVAALAAASDTGLDLQRE